MTLARSSQQQQVMVYHASSRFSTQNFCHDYESSRGEKSKGKQKNDTYKSGSFCIKPLQTSQVVFRVPLG